MGDFGRALIVNEAEDKGPKEGKAGFKSAFGGHEFKWKAVLILFLILIAFSYGVFVKGLTLPFPLCPQFIENCPIR